MSTYKTKCDICGTENEVPNYGDWACSQCGQAYEYDEGHRILLTPEQLATLRQMPVIGRLGDQVMKDIVQAFAGVPEWIPVSERLPEDDQPVLVWSQSNGLHIAYLDLWRQWRDADDNPGKKITHWMPLPEPPEVK